MAVFFFCLFCFVFCYFTNFGRDGITDVGLYIVCTEGYAVLWKFLGGVRIQVFFYIVQNNEWDMWEKCFMTLGQTGH